jgi:hypothetical protein
MLSASSARSQEIEQTTGLFRKPWSGHAQPHCPTPAPFYMEPSPKKDGEPKKMIEPKLEERPPILEAFEPEQSIAALAGERAAVAERGGGAYIDLAVPITQFRLRVDSAFNNNRPDRAEFFYPKCGCLRIAALQGQPGGDINAAGPPMMEPFVDYQEIRPYFEYAPSDRWSVFLEVPYRMINPDVNSNQEGIGDIMAGFKYAFIAQQERYVTFQMSTWAPTGLGMNGLGNNHVSVEPAVLFYQTLSDRLTLQAEVRDWIAVSGSDYAGNILRYGAGLTYLANDPCSNVRIYPVGEVVGWNVLTGKESTAAGATLQSDATIVNGKLGVRFGFGQPDGPGIFGRSDLYIGYARALTGAVWYKDMYRLEYRMRF